VTFSRNSGQKTTKKREKRRFREMNPGLGSAIRFHFLGLGAASLFQTGFEPIFTKK